MKKFLLIFGTVSFIGLVVLIGAIVVGIFHILEVSEEAEAYVEDRIVSITSQWDPNEIINHASPELLEVIEPGQIEDLFDSILREVGNFVSLSALECSANSIASTSQEPTTIATCEAQVKHERGTGDYQIQAVKRSDIWKLLKFHVNAKADSQAATDI